jgi:hypothetical protein
MRINFSKTINDIKEDPDLKLNLRYFKVNYVKFKAMSSMRKRNQLRNNKQMEYVVKLIMARTILDNMLIRCKSFFDPIKNIYIFKLEKDINAYKSLLSYVGIATARLDIMQDELKVIERESAYIPQGVVAPVKLVSFSETMKEYVYNFIVVSIYNAYNKFSNLDVDTYADEKGRVPKKDRLLFSWFLFMEFLRVSDYFGNLARQMASSGTSTKLKTLETNQTHLKDIPQMPSNLIYEEAPEEQRQLIDPFEEVLDVVD